MGKEINFKMPTLHCCEKQEGELQLNEMNVVCEKCS